MVASLHSVAFLAVLLVYKALAVSWPYEDGYHRNTATKALMDNLQTSYPHLIRLHLIGKSVNDLEMWTMELSNFQDEHSVLMRRNVRLIGSVFGDEVVGRELLLNFAYYLVSTYDSKNATSPHLLDVLRIHILPAMNPDGSEISKEGGCSNGIGRRNSNAKNLDVNFPLVSSNETPAEAEPETVAVIEWMQRAPTVFSLTFRANAYVVAYPYGAREGKNIEHLTPDDDVFKFLATTYADHSPLIKMETPCNNSHYKNGIVNSAVLKNMPGSLQDYSYTVMNSLHLNIGITCCRYPLATQLPIVWQQNKQALSELLLVVCGGLDGKVRDGNNMQPISGARIVILGREEVSLRSSNMKGSFSRILLPGNYTLKVSKNGYSTTKLVAYVNTLKTVRIGNVHRDVYTGHVEVLLYPAVNNLKSTLQTPPQVPQQVSGSHSIHRATTFVSKLLIVSSAVYNFYLYK